MSRYAWSWEDFYADFPLYRPDAATAPAPDPAPPPCLPDQVESAAVIRARELLAMGVEGAMVRRCVQLTAEDLAALGLAGGAHEPHV